MSAMQGALSAAERSMRSVFVGNIPYEATEEQLKDIFSEVGPVVSFRLVYDRETGKPKGYGFCEYKDQEMALCAMRNLNGYELNGRALRVDNAASEKSKEELKNLQASLGGPPVESPYGPDAGPEKAPEEISKAVASLPPEQMFELMKQMKMCIENNPNEARNLLLQNPQLAYALLQAQVIMRIVDPQVAMGMLHRPNTATPAGSNIPSSVPKLDQLQTSPQLSAKSNMVIPGVNDISSGFPAVTTGGMPMNTNMGVPRPPMPQVRPSLLGERPPVMTEPPRPMMSNQFPDRDPRAMADRDMRQPPVIDRDMRPPPMLMGDKDMRNLGDQDLRNLGGGPGPIPDNRPFDPRFRGMQGPPVGNREQVPPNPFDRARPGPNFDPRSGYEGRPGGPGRIEDPRNAPMGGGNPPVGRLPSNQRLAAVTNSPILQSSPNAVSSPRQSSALAAAAAAIAPHDQEKAALIMQVLQLSDQQIAVLPPEQRQSIMILKEQIARSQQLQ